MATTSVFYSILLKDIYDYVLLFALAAIASGVFTAGYIHALRKRQLFEVPNRRSMHIKPVLIGGGWSLLVVILLFWPVTQWPLEESNVALLLSIVLLALVSWLDDLESLPWALRLFAHAIAVVIFLMLLPADSVILGGWLPVSVERVILFFAYLWFINLYNFMDGIDGITGVQTAALEIGYFLITGLIDYDSEFRGLSIIVSGAAVGYLLWNWYPAKIIMGDVGSIPLGFVLGGMMIDLALRGQLVAAIILPLYYLCDATITLIGRIFRREQFLKPHREHYYQRAVLGGASHEQVVSRIAIVNTLLVCLAALSITWPLWSLVGAAILVALLLAYFQYKSQGIPLGVK